MLQSVPQTECMLTASLFVALPPGGAQQSDQRRWVLRRGGGGAGPAGQDRGAGVMKVSIEFHFVSFHYCETHRERQHCSEGRRLFARASPAARAASPTSHFLSLSASRRRAGYLDSRPFLRRTPTPPSGNIASPPRYWLQPWPSSTLMSAVFLSSLFVSARRRFSVRVAVLLLWLAENFSSKVSKLHLAGWNFQSVSQLSCWC